VKDSDESSSDQPLLNIRKGPTIRLRSFHVYLNVSATFVRIMYPLLKTE
jgi:hypothetical protein